MDQKQRQLIKKYIDLILCRKKLILICAMIAVVGGVGFYLKNPKRYKATSLLIYQRQKVNPTQMSPDVQTRTRKMVSTLSQQVTSRTSLESLIKQFKLYQQQLQRLPMEDVVANMRKTIEIKPSRGDIFHVSYTGSNPRKVMLVTNALAARFVEENLRFREEKASETSAYVKDELNMAKAALDKKEELMRDYKLKYYNEMPQQLQLNITQLTSLQRQLQGNQDSIMEFDRTRLLIHEQITRLKTAITEINDKAKESQWLETLVMPQQASAPEGPLTVLQQELKNARAVLDSFLLKYTENHPQVKKQKKQVAILESKYNNLLAPTAESTNGEESSQEEAPAPMSQAEKRKQAMIAANEQQMQQLDHQLKEVSYNINMLRENEKKLHKQIEQYKTWVKAAPVREAEWSALTRDYDQLDSHYQNLVARNLAAESAESLERRQKGSQFKIVDSAHYPEKPFTPVFFKIMAMAIGLGVGIGGTIAFILDLVDTSFKDPTEIETHLSVPVVCSIPIIQTKKERKRGLIMATAWFIVLTGAGLTIIAGILYCWHKGMIII